MALWQRTDFHWHIAELAEGFSCKHFLINYSSGISFLVHSIMNCILSGSSSRPARKRPASRAFLLMAQRSAWWHATWHHASLPVRDPQQDAGHCEACQVLGEVDAQVLPQPAPVSGVSKTGSKPVETR